MAKVTVDTKWSGLKIRYDPAAEPYFPLTVKEQLDLIASKPVGKSLLDGIAKCKLPEKFGYRVVIMRASNVFDLSEEILWKRAKGSNTTFGSDMSKAVMRNGSAGEGTVSAIKYNPNAYESPDGRRPPWMGLAHELIHAYNNAYGISLQNNVDDEAKTTGLLQFTNHDLTENLIRKEHGLDRRVSYYGLIDHQDHVVGNKPAHV